jgi:anti-sigma regulatory factor (Ser/Thr protein kinase)
MQGPDGGDREAALLTVTFTLERIDDVRHRVRELSRDSGLSGDYLTDWVMAINELTTNAVRHGSVSAELTLHRAGRLVCRVRDQGSGFDPAGYLGRRRRPPLTGTGGMGLWLVEQTTELLSLTSGPGGTTVCVASREHLPELPAPPGEGR